MLHARIKIERPKSLFYGYSWTKLQTGGCQEKLQDLEGLEFW